MIKKNSPAGVIAIILLLTSIISCNNIRNRDVNGLAFDTSRAARFIIPISEAIALQDSFITTRSELSKLTRDTTFLTKNFNLPNAETFTKDALLLLLSQKNADGIRFYYGKDSNGVVRLVLLPVTKDGKDIYTKLITSSRNQLNIDSSAPGFRSGVHALDTTDNEAVETGQTCPPCLITP